MTIEKGLDWGLKHNDGVESLSHNRTFIVQKFTDLPDLVPEVVTDLQTVNDFFNHFKPQVSVKFHDSKGKLIHETVEFRNITYFAPESMLSKSDFLNRLEREKTCCFEVLKTLNTDEDIQVIIRDDTAKTALLQKIKALKEELRKT
ncbi:hypothetical protein [Pseudotamlana carrageenivorans]|uniref:Uncharacterized protein n=1 Tax=Pseudotamlana carrageenivorans TaxID=2069432 RepID=A0A2I7SKD3_9FLAO|nr:hypothetical protein [Tamlana carrageenivorans]AUS06369.1 hypothetical protein C1A40_13355 [Tamlana carrageenivorans]